MIGLFLTIDVGPGYDFFDPTPICQQLLYSPFYPQGKASDLVVSIDSPVHVLIDPPAKPHVMNQAQRDAMERAFWNSVEVLDDGHEG